MDVSIITAIISGIFSVVAAFGSIWLKYRLDQQTAKEKEITSESTIPDKPVSSPRPWAGVIRPLLILIAGFSFGILSEVLDQTMVETGSRGYNWGFLAFVALCIICLILIFIHRRLPKGLWSYQLDVLILWSANLFGFSLGRGSLWSDAIAFSVTAWIISALVGGIMVLITRKRNAR
jgi:uncharacterized membrane-anchored protein